MFQMLVSFENGHLFKNPLKCKKSVQETNLSTCKSYINLNTFATESQGETL